MEAVGKALHSFDRAQCDRTGTNPSLHFKAPSELIQLAVAKSMPLDPRDRFKANRQAALAEWRPNTEPSS